MGTRFDNIFLSEKRTAGDPAADQLIATVFGNAEQKAALKLWLDALTDNAALRATAGSYSDQPVIKNACQLPGWADKKVMAEGAAFFARHAETIMSLLGLLSLPYCYAAAQGAMVLHLSQRMKTDAGRRLTETAQFVWDVMDPDAFSETGRGFSSILKVRLMHAAVRWYTLCSGGWDNAWGVPVNQEDMAGTNLSFSFIVIRGLRNWGYSIGYREQQAFIHLWNVIGALSGLDDDLLPLNGAEAIRLEEGIRLRQFKPSEHGRELTLVLIQYFSHIKDRLPFPPEEIIQLMRYLLGNEVADILGILSAELPAQKIRLLKINSSINGLIAFGDSKTAYQNAYKKFRSLALF